MKEWFTAAELSSLRLPDIPSTESAMLRLAKRERWQERTNMGGGALARRRKGRGGGWEYHYSLLPMRAQSRLVAEDVKARRAEEAEDEAAAPPAGADGSDLWDWYDRLPDSRKAIARDRLRVLQAVELLYRGGLSRNLAVYEVAKRERMAGSTIYLWLRLVKGADPGDRLPLLAPRHRGKTVKAEVDPEAWDYLVSDYLRAAQPSLTSCLERLRRVAGERGWTLPSNRTLRRRIERELPQDTVVLARQGKEALERRRPAQQRDRSVFTALEAVNADGHKFDVFVRWPDGHVGRPVGLFWQDLRSGKLLSWRVDKSENADAFRLSLGDLLELGVPKHVYLDNTRAAASKWLTGGVPHRFRFKVRQEEPAGVLQALGIELHWTRPYHGQSKPIERAFGDLADYISRHPAFEGAYTGNSPMTKPHNYGSRQVPLAEFLAVVEQEVAAHNARSGRRGGICDGRSFDAVFAESIERTAVRQASPEQRRMCLLAAEQVTARKPDGAVHLLKNRYWCPELADRIGESLVLRFDPQHLHSGVHVYATDGRYVGYAGCIEAVGFGDREAAREVGRAERAKNRAVREHLESMRRHSAAEVAAMLPAPAAGPDLTAKVVTPIRAAAHSHLTTSPHDPRPTPDLPSAEEVAATVTRLEERRARPAEPTDAELYAKWKRIDAAIAAGEEVGDRDRRWHERFQQSVAWRAQSKFEKWSASA